MQSILHSVIGPQKVQPENLDGRVAVVTGGALGIGFEVAAALAGAGARVIMVNRDEEQGSSAIDEVQKRYPGAQIEWERCDLGSLAEVRRVFSRIRDEKIGGRLDFLVLSAGINTNQYGEDADGIDRHFGVNYLGNMYVTNLLWPALRKTSRTAGAPAPRVVFVSSEMHRAAPSDVRFASLDEINNPKLGPMELYGRTKLAQILLAKYGLAGKVIKESCDRIYALSVHPGAVNTAMQQQWKEAYPGLTGKLLSWASQAIGRDVEQGSYSTLWALTAPEIEEKDWNGWYFSDVGQEGKESNLASDREVGENLWKLGERIIKDKLGEDAMVDWNGRDL